MPSTCPAATSDPVTAPNLAQSSAPKSIVPAELVIDLFDVRLEIIKYANPLRAKILLFSIVYYPFTNSAQDWSNLKLYSLDGLLRSLTTCGSIADLQTKLETIAQQLSQPDDYAQVSHVLIKCLKPIYTQLQQQVCQTLQSSVAETTQASLTQVLVATQE
ncbi:MAG: hypothetical protein HC936_17095 [Leptolyngbyaceae cyanobacterium SU_3_3]|nr:hypothetical protein [Leptolyngbyaceae cyanobacterium SU_3_3]